MIRIISATLFNNGDQETIELDKVIPFSELETYRKELSEKHKKQVYFTYKTI
jgi:hypothetical protein